MCSYGPLFPVGQYTLAVSVAWRGRLTPANSSCPCRSLHRHRHSLYAFDLPTVSQSHHHRRRDQDESQTNSIDPQNAGRRSLNRALGQREHRKAS